jgi:ribosomal protein L16/L10AE
MLLAPSRYKYRKQHRGRMKGTAQRGSTLAFGSPDRVRTYRAYPLYEARWQSMDSRLPR